jgi:hypothetical protein
MNEQSSKHQQALVNALTMYLTSGSLWETNLKSIVRFTLRMGVSLIWLRELNMGHAPSLQSLIWPLFVVPIFV